VNIPYPAWGYIHNHNHSPLSLVIISYMNCFPVFLLSLKILRKDKSFFIPAKQAHSFFMNMDIL